MNTLIYVLFLILFASSPGFCETAWEKYLSFPSPERASKVSAIEYSPGSYVDKGYPPDLKILQNQILAGDSAAFRLAYRLMETSDGGLLEGLIAILGHTIRSRPEFFLKELSALKPSSETLEFILLMPGLEYVDRPAAQRYELEKRLEAIKTVQAKGLKNFRDKCSLILTKKLASNK